MAKSMSRNLEKVRKEGELVGISISQNIKGINHSHFSNDTIFLGSVGDGALK